MGKLQLLLFTFVLVLRTFAAKRDDSCVTPNNETATCMPLTECNIINQPVKEGYQWALEWAKKSLCNETTDDDLVCCGTISGKSSKIDFKSYLRRPKARTVTAETISTITKFGELSDTSVCGVDKLIYDRIWGGTTTELGESPWMAALEYKSKSDITTEGIKCGGTLLNNRYVLTAAHCVLHIEFMLVNAWLGVWNVTSDLNCFNMTECVSREDRVLKFKIEKTIPHELYRSYHQHDIALLRSENQIMFTDYVRPICILPSDLPFPENGTLMTVSGWGFFNSSDELSEIKMKVKVPVRPNTDCNKLLEKRGVNKTITSNQLCAGGEAGKDACQGDSGGPLMRIYKVLNQIRWFQEGIVSYSINANCGIRGIPAVYTRVTNYVKWIANKIQQDTIFASEEENCGAGSDLDTFPWLAILEYKSKLTNKTEIRCGGSLISSRYFLTAAYCTQDKEFVVINAWLGVLNITSGLDCSNLTECLGPNDRVQKIKIQEVFLHGPYKNTNGHEIALLQSENKIKFTDYIHPICIPRSHLSTPELGTTITFARWSLKQTEFELSSRAVPLNGIRGVVTQNELRAKEEIAGNAACDDSQGFVYRTRKDITSHQSKWYLEGLVPSPHCATNTIVYIPVSKNLNWIVNVITKE